ncbi:uncharacterized protein BJ212DRAFT_1302722 [Suillus subaureus]|uniref:Uncharacterized protein n=1 Tax=Suillus subaureus TaxID=48587 RepID=A0A9P7J8R0_9AGAM|nr:uncharacterized protein BJ212DRAFT_1302722 [Suillus subaureus]KAG1809160.1 hypothetical protein BJ212DRAFT_1302722 [Suillus subaureus]
MKHAHCKGQDEESSILDSQKHLELVDVLIFALAYLDYLVSTEIIATTPYFLSEDVEAVTQDTEVVTELVPEDTINDEEEPGDDAPLELLLQFVASGIKCAPDGYRIDADGLLVVDSASDTFKEVAISTDPDTTFGRGKHRHVANKQYDAFEEH